MPGRVSITSVPPAWANLARRFRTWLSIVRSVTAKPGPCSRSMIESRLNTFDGIAANVLLLAYFKYTGFLVQVADQVWSRSTGTWEPDPERAALPAGQVLVVTAP